MNLKLKRLYFFAVNVLIAVVGLLLISWGIILGGSFVRPFLEAIGIGLLVAGAVNILDRSLTLEALPPPLQRIEVVAEKRSATPQYISDLKYKAAKVDIIGISLNHFIKELVNDPKQEIINRLLKHNLQLRLFLVHPNSKYLEQRAREDKEDISDLIKRQKHAVELCVKFYEQLRDSYRLADETRTLDTHLTGSLQIKLLDFCPYMSIYRIDEEDIYWGLYTSDTAGLNLPLFKTSATNDLALHKYLHQHIHGLMERDMKYPDLVSMREMGEPTLNQKLVDQILK